MLSTIFFGFCAHSGNFTPIIADVRRTKWIQRQISLMYMCICTYICIRKHIFFYASVCICYVYEWYTSTYSVPISVREVPLLDENTILTCSKRNPCNVWIEFWSLPDLHDIAVLLRSSLYRLIQSCYPSSLPSDWGRLSSNPLPDVIKRKGTTTPEFWL